MDAADSDQQIPDQRSSGRPAGSLIDDIVDDVVSIEELSIRTSQCVRRVDVELFELCVTTTALLRMLADELGRTVEPYAARARRDVATRMAFQAFCADEIFAADARAIGAPEEFRLWAEEELGEMFPATLMESIDYRALFGLTR